MVWSQVEVNKPHLVYIILGGFTSLFMLCSSVIKERFYIGEATVATLCGIIFGPHAANLIDPNTWGNTDQITLEFCRIVLVVQCFAVGVELPRSYMERHWRSVVFLLIPVMTFGWLITSLFIWALLGSHLNWLDSLVCAACVTATDPVLASSVVGKGKFAKRVPKHLRDILSAESGCNDGMAFPFIYLGLYLVLYNQNAREVTFHWICVSILYECVFGAVYGVLVGYIARRAIRYAHERDLIDRESFLVFYFVLALFCAGSGSILGIDDLLVGFACGVGFSNDGWFLEKTEEAHVSNVIDLLINLTFFVYFGTIIPWAQYNSAILGTSPWRLVIIAILVLLFRRIPIMMALKPLIPDVKTWREALFAGHFGPIGVGAIFVAILARAELETDSTTPLAVLPEAGFPHLNVIELIWPITTFLVIASIIVHGSSIAVFTLGKHINTLTITMTYTKDRDTEGGDYSWMDRLPRIQTRSKTSASMRRPGESQESFDEKMPDYPDAVLPKNFLRRQKEEDNPSRSNSVAVSGRRRKWDTGMGPGGPISQSAITPQRRESPLGAELTRSGSDTLALNSEQSSERSGEKRRDSPNRRTSDPDRNRNDMEVYEEGDDTIIEDRDGNVLKVIDSSGQSEQERRKNIQEEVDRLKDENEFEDGVLKEETRNPMETLENKIEEGLKVFTDEKKEGKHEEEVEKGSGMKNMRKTMERMATLTNLKRNNTGHQEAPPKREPLKNAGVQRRSGPARAYRIGRTIIVEDEDGEVIKQYEIPAPERDHMERKPSHAGGDAPRNRLERMGTWLGLTHGDKTEGEEGPSNSRPQAQRKKSTVAQLSDNEDDNIRFTLNGDQQRMSKAEFIRQISFMDPKQRAKVVEGSNAPEPVKREARADVADQAINGKKKLAPGRVKVGEAKGGNGNGNATIQHLGVDDDQATGPEGLTLTDSHGTEFPFFAASEERRGRPVETERAAQRRRMAALQSATEENSDSEDDGTERVPPSSRHIEDHVNTYFAPRHPDPAPRASTNRVPQRPSTVEAETAAERRRREGALGFSKETSDSEEEDDGPRAASSQAEPAPSQRAGIRFADQPKNEAQQPQKTGIRWGADRGRSFKR